MNSMLFSITLLAGIFVFLLGLKQRRLELIDSKFMKRQKNQTKIVEYIYRYFKNIYERDSGFNRKNMIILLAILSVLLAINVLFLNLPYILVVAVGVIFGIYVVNFLHARAIAQDFEKNFPEVLTILYGAISAGSNVTQALQDCTTYIDGVLKVELTKIVRAMNIGDDTQKVFDASYRNLPFKNYYFFLTALNVSLTSGAKLKEVLSRISTTTLRVKAIEKKKSAMTSEVRMSSKITAAIPFVFLFLMKFISPENFDFILYDDRGRYILYYFLGSEILGVLITMFLMRKI